LFLRSVAVEAGAPGTQGRRYEGLRIAFRASFNAGYPGQATIQIWNPDPGALALFKPRTNEVTLKAGYGGEERILFRGNPMRDGVQLEIVGDGDRVLTVDATDGGRGFTDTLISKSYATRISWGEVIDELLHQTRWQRGQILLPIETLTTPGPLVLHDRPVEVMDRIAELVSTSIAGEEQGADWFVRDGALYLISRKKGTTNEPALLISAREGNLIGSPTATSRGCRLRALIDASMRPHRAISVQSELVNGVFKVSDVSFSGDNWANEFYMDITAKTLSASVVA
jgi:hypothetical protein